MKWAAIKKLIFVPLVQRLGTMLATVLLATGADGELVNQVVTGVIASSLIIADLAMNYVSQKQGNA
jgi:hypothetical protein